MLMHPCMECLQDGHSSIYDAQLDVPCVHSHFVDAYSDTVIQLFCLFVLFGFGCANNFLRQLEFACLCVTSLSPACLYDMPPCAHGIEFPLLPLVKKR